MISILSVLTGILLFAYVAYASYVGLRLASVFRWYDFAHRGHLSLRFSCGMAMAPFLLGLCAALSLFVFAGYSSKFHLFITALLLFGLHGTLTFFECKKKYLSAPALELESRFFLIFIVVWVFFLVINSLQFGLFQNDALEYMTVARQLFITNSLHSYPMINQEPTTSGFYGPWTHPPLYPILIYFFSAVKGSASTPGLARLIAPWFALLSTLLVYSMGAIRDRLTGLISAFVLLSMPLFFIGATTSLIDSLPILGFFLVIAVLSGLKDDFKSKWMLLGVVMGFALWSHSQAILLIPILCVLLACYFGVLAWRKILIALFTTLSIAVSIAAWPYIKNYFLYGALISDNPAIFSLGQLNWHDYFDYARGLDNTTAVIQYGVFKGLFSLEAFSLSFWFALIGCVVFLYQLGIRKEFKSVFVNGLTHLPAVSRLYFICFVVLLTYFLGTVLSVCLGMNLMIKNERYLLVMAPFAALFTAYACSTMIRFLMAYCSKKKAYQFFYYLASVLVFFLIALNCYVVGVYYPNRYVRNNKLEINKVNFAVHKQHEDKHVRLLDNLPSTSLMLKFQQQGVSKEALILSLRPADMYYSNRKMLSFLDDRLVPFYQEKDKYKAFSILKKLGVTHIHATEYALPVQYATALQAIISDPTLTKMVVPGDGSELYALVESRSTEHLIKRFKPGMSQWSYYKIWNILGRKRLEARASLQTRYHLINGDEMMNFTANLPLNHRHYAHMLLSDVALSVSDSNFGVQLSLEPGKEYRVDFELEGEGLVDFYLLEFSKTLRPIFYYQGMNSALRIGEVVLAKSRPKISYSKRFVAKGHKVRFMLTMVGSSKLKILNANLIAIDKD